MAMLLSSPEMLYYLCLCITHLPFSLSLITKLFFYLVTTVNIIFRNYNITY